MKTIIWGALAGLLVGGASAPAFAQTDEQSSMTIFGYNVNASVRARVQPTYEGSNKYTIGPAGSISFSKPGEARVFSAPDDSTSFSLFGNDKVSVGLAGRLRAGRDDDDDDDLRGLKKIDMAVEVGGFLNLWVTDWLRTRLEVRRGFGGHEGVLVDVGADMVRQEGRWTGAIGPRFSYADEEYTRTYFGVTPQEAIASPLIALAYTPSGGARYAGVQASADYQWTKRWGVTFDAGYRRLMGDAADSPLVSQLGREDQFNASAGVRYTFGD